MDVCEECQSIEQGFTYKEEDGEEIPVCDCCGAENSKKSYDEDAGSDR